MPIIQTITGRSRDLGGFSVSRVLPAPARRTLGPFVFFDEMGPADFPAGQGIDVRPHPHIGLATVTYLFAGGLTHRDSLGTVIDIAPGAVNWMTAGRGITHSERSPTALREAGHHMHGIQSWVALPVAHAEDAPAFVHHPADTLPVVGLPGARLTIIAGTMFGATSPVRFPHPIIYAELHLRAGASLALDPAWGEIGVYPITGAAHVDGSALTPGSLAVVEGAATLTANTPLHAMILGGAPFAEPRIIEWNFVSHSRDRITQAETDWRAGDFPQVPGETEFIPLPETPPKPQPRVDYP
ncbi:pirin family protein [Sandarakinorhabdus sp.]|uniref:pirin family protein n=1 Tax=Sandarakinorhabdus sp. TaxID=1916663 RepID=UPI00286E7C51|nr:pirin family protein [Sandarakinorhabdus sp.]